MTQVLHFDEEVEERKKNELSLSLISALSEAYSTLYYVDPDSGEYQLISRSRNFDDKVLSKMVTGSTFYTDTATIFPEFSVRMTTV